MWQFLKFKRQYNHLISYNLTRREKRIIKKQIIEIQKQIVTFLKLYHFDQTSCLAITMVPLSFINIDTHVEYIIQYFKQKYNIVLYNETNILFFKTNYQYILF